VQGFARRRWVTLGLRLAGQCARAGKQHRARTNLATGELIQRPICLWKPDRAPRCAAYEPQPAQDLSSHEMHAIVAALKSTGGNIRLAARQLNVSRGGLYNKMSRFGLNAGDFRGA
jgi:transcriptional regulator of acetoin/glycerol metabolism